MAILNSIDLSLQERLKNPEFRREWFRAELETRVPELFRDLRERRNLTQAELAVKADMKQSAISRFEASAEATWKLETLLRLADALDAKLSLTLVPAESVVAQYINETLIDKQGSSILDALDQLPRPEGSSLRRQTALVTQWFERTTSEQKQAGARQSVLKGSRPWN
ncbi:helix-turn-helix transcriptional regulator [Hyphomicrobium sp. NDB2Meth4]|uniref:helix-turn-helix domain-containing protein n=1 Tax=Hyphomicrobium sp. NDB2Meth4 TaxID=1892846 RepID=UPI0009F8506B|nr:helix-turn-helix transcriptional regulator [Hyphomicrobium sp. NDB2Meth4]